MIRKIPVIGAMIIGVLFALPVAALAEDTSVGGTAKASVTLDTGSQGDTPPGGAGRPVPTLYKMDGSVTGGVKAPGTLPPGAMMKGGHMATGTKPIPKGMEMRDKMMASGTKPIPTGIEARMEGRDSERMRMMGSGTPERMGRGDCGPAASSSDCGDKRGKGERRGEMLRHAAELIFHRVEAAIGRFNKLADRIDSRITKQKGQGTDTSVAEADVAAARAKTKEAQDALDAAKALVVSAGVSADASTTVSTDAGKPVREQLEKAKQALTEAAKDLEAAVTALKGQGNGGEGMHDGTSSPKMPGMMRTRDHESTSTANGNPDGTL